MHQQSVLVIGDCFMQCCCTLRKHAPDLAGLHGCCYLQVYKPINPKAVTRNELYGYLHPSTREWKEGLVSVTFRDMANNSTNKHQWIVLDGDIDAGA
jgi:hypothetical protein